MDDNSAKDRADRSATMPERMNEMITEGPAYRAAAVPLLANMPDPENPKPLTPEFIYQNSSLLTNGTAESNRN